MFSMVYVAGEDAAHTEFVRGFIAAFPLPPGRINVNPSRVKRVTGKIGDGRERMYADAQAAVKVLKTLPGQSRVLVLVHDLGRDEPDRLRRTIIGRIAEEAGIEDEWLSRRSVVLLPEPETEAWIAAVLDEVYRPGNNERKKELGRQAFHAGKKVGEMCGTGSQARLPDSIRAFCDEVGRHTEGLR